MPLTRTSLDWQLNQAQADLKAWASALNEKGIASEQHRLDPRWRSLNARCRQLKARLRAVGRIEARDEEAARRKAEAPSSAGESGEE